MNFFDKLTPELEAQYNIHLNFEWAGKVVLDIGAESGTSAEYFFKHGAKFVTCIEGDQRLASLCVENLAENHMPNFDVVVEWIDSPHHFDRLLSFYGRSGPRRTDVVKIDIEGWECCMLDMNDQILADQRELVIDTHSRRLTDLLVEKLKKNNFKILDDVVGDVIHAVSMGPEPR
jgi:precorrin-6B methylase 2